MVVAGAIIGALILLTALYVAAEFAAVGARRSRLRRLAEDGDSLAARVLPVVEDPRALDRYIAASQVGITLCSLILGAYAQASIAPRVAPFFASALSIEPRTADSTAAVVVLLVLTTLAMILGELVPKSLALQDPTNTARYTVLPMQWSLYVFSWSIRVLNGSGVLVLRALGVPSTGHRHVHSPEEIALLIAESRDGGLLEPQEQVRLHRALRLGLRTARQLMVPRDRLVAIELSTPFEEIVRVVAVSAYSRLPVYRSSLDQVVGILHIKDLVTDYVADPRRPSIVPLLRPIVRVADTMPADKLLVFLREHRSQQAIVVDGTGAVAGLITLEDVVAELLGGISDEFKGPQLRAVVLSDGRVRLPGSMRIEQLVQLLGPIWEPRDETIAAFVAAAAGHLPQPGERVTVAGVPVEIEALEGGAIASVIMDARRGQEPG
ncbi:MAG TPA: hemolysin family protein [Vicinamibacterales bacterium]|nr:hemolysin family protein [Vicinamibacterales bacterium]